MQSKRFHVTEWYETLNAQQQKVLRDGFCEHFQCSPQTFERTMKGRQLTADRLLFFAEFLQVGVDDLTFPPEVPQIRPVRPERGQKKLEFR